ncbi:MAG: hypothetical protein ACLFWB_03800 [Armatimonadota bacterium]
MTVLVPQRAEDERQPEIELLQTDRALGAAVRIDSTEHIVAFRADEATDATFTVRDVECRNDIFAGSWGPDGRPIGAASIDWNE